MIIKHDVWLSDMARVPYLNDYKILTRGVQTEHVRTERCIKLCHVCNYKTRFMMAFRHETRVPYLNDYKILTHGVQTVY